MKFDLKIQQILEKLAAYHGSTTNFNTFNTVLPTRNPITKKRQDLITNGNNMMGWGIYFTSDIQRAKNFANYNNSPEKANVYNVEIDADLNELLDWYKPLSEQSLEVRRGLIAVANYNPKFLTWLRGTANDPRIRDKFGNYTKYNDNNFNGNFEWGGAIAYKSLATCLNPKNSKEAYRSASEVLYRIGKIKGTFCNKPSDYGFHNVPLNQGEAYYCIFDPKLISIDGVNQNLQPNNQAIKSNIKLE